jgi:hypothetical protein
MNEPPPPQVHRLLSEVCSTSSASHGAAPDLRLTPLLPPPAAVAVARSFDDLDNLAEAFEGFRLAHRSSLNACAAIADGRRSAMRAEQMASSSSSAASFHHHAAPESNLPYPAGFSFLHCLVQVADPATPLLQPSDASRCVARFLERASATLERDRTRVAADYRAALGAHAPPAGELLDSLRDPIHALSDVGLNDAAVLSLARLLRVSVVVRQQGPQGARVRTFPPTTAPTDPAILVRWDAPSKRFALDVGVGSTLRDVQRRLAAEDEGARAAAGLGAAELAKRPLPELKALAERCAASTGRGRITKAVLAEAIAACLL